jgi:glycosyltransferase involved in cell wall biosynthesis
MAALIGRMLEQTDFKFASVSFGDVRHTLALHDERTECFVIPKGWSEFAASFGGGLQECQRLVNEWKPDLIHIHGTESAYGLLTARGLVKCPAIISLQGLLGPCSEWYHYFGNSSLMDIIRMHRWLEVPAMRGHWMGFLQIRKKARLEGEIIAGNRFFMGRTKWDQAHLQALNPSAHYFHEGRLLRDDFWGNIWDIKRIVRHRIIVTSSGHPRKGTELVLDAVKLLKPRYPDIQVCIAGRISRRSGYGRYITRRISEMEGAAVELGSLDAAELTSSLLTSHVFVSPSFIENSPNALSEAQLLGMPVIATYTGGTPSLIEEMSTGLFFPTGDVPMLAERIRNIFEDDELAVRLGSRARSVARQRHDPDSIVREILSIYDDVLKVSK